MAWDIYGNPLKAGHCEVHPEVPIPWPCHLCLAENAQYEHDVMVETHDEVAELCARITALEDALRPFAVAAYEGGFRPDFNDNDVYRVRVGDIRNADRVLKGE